MQAKICVAHLFLQRKQVRQARSTHRAGLSADLGVAGVAENAEKGSRNGVAEGRLNAVLPMIYFVQISS